MEGFEGSVLLGAVWSDPQVLEQKPQLREKGISSTPLPFPGHFRASLGRASLMTYHVVN